MPQLPSGRHVAIQATPLFALMERALQGGVITRLLRIEHIEQLWPYVDVMYFLELPGVSPVNVAPGGLPVPSDLEPYASGCTLATIGSELTGWSEADREAFDAYVASERVQVHLAALLREVTDLLDRLAREGEFETRLQALMWKTHCHPVQGDETDDPMFDLLEDPYDPNTGAGAC